MADEISSDKLQLWLPDVCKIAIEAGVLISEKYHELRNNLNIELKNDGTPVTEVDLLADQHIYSALQSLTPDIPLVTEESYNNFDFDSRRDWSLYWLVDPLDGTKEFIAGTGEFSVNIALVVNHHPVLGVVYGPEVGSLYFAIHDQSAYKATLTLSVAPRALSDISSLVKSAVPIQVAQIESGSHIKVAVSRRHGGHTQHFMSELGPCEMVKMGSALKTCLVAEGKAHVYPRFGPTSLWDTGASQVILEAAGGVIINAAGHPLEYIQTPSLLNPFFIAVCNKNYPWPKIPEIL